MNSVTDERRFGFGLPLNIPILILLSSCRLLGGREPTFLGHVLKCSRVGSLRFVDSAANDRYPPCASRGAHSTFGMTVHVRLSAEVSIHLSAEVGADISTRTARIGAQVSADLGDDASADAAAAITQT